MRKLEVIQAVIDKISAKTYLEIGVENGVNFMPIKVKNKIAVDPKFAITKKSKLKWLVLNWNNILAEFHECSSDEYFKSCKDKKYDVVFVDGLHTYYQSLRDVENALSRLNEFGVIVIHDCIPPHRAAAHPSQLTQKQAENLGIEGWTPNWCGDVWKTICFLRSQRLDLKVFTLDFDFGIGIVMRGKPESMLDISENQLNLMTYEDLIKNKNSLLNIKSTNTLKELMKYI